MSAVVCTKDFSVYSSPHGRQEWWGVSVQGSHRNVRLLAQREHVSHDFLTLLRSYYIDQMFKARPRDAPMAQHSDGNAPIVQRVARSGPMKLKSVLLQGHFTI